MASSWSVLLMIHLIGLALGVGCATSKVVLLIKSYRDPAFIQVYTRVVRPLTRLLVLGLVLMTLSGIIWLVLGYGFSTILIIKLCFVGLVWILGIVIDNVTEPKYLKLAPVKDEKPSASFMDIQKKHIALETFAALVFYIIMVLGISL